MKLSSSRKCWLILLTVTVLLAAACGQNEQPITIVSGGKAKAVVVVADEANEKVMAAAKVLQTTVAEMSGASLAIKTVSEYEQESDGAKVDILVGH